jgi:uncharacterized protein
MQEGVMSGRLLVWQWLSEPGIEQVRVESDAAGVRAQSRALGVWDEVPSRAAYRLTLDADWRFRLLDAAWSDSEGIRRVRLWRNQDGGWHDTRGPRPDLDGCEHIDVNWTPLTNTLPIRRIGLAPGEAREISVVYVPVPSLEIQAVPQRYTRLDERRWCFESLESGFMAELIVDADGIVTEYEGLFRLVSG